MGAKTPPPPVQIDLALYLDRAFPLSLPKNSPDMVYQTGYIAGSRAVVDWLLREAAKQNNCEYEVNRVYRIKHGEATASGGNAPASSGTRVA